MIGFLRYRIFQWSIKLIILALLFWVIANRVDVSSIQFDTLSIDFYWLGMVVLLMFVNYTIESWKWYFGVHTFGSISFKKAVKSICIGQALSIITVARVGEYPGRVFLLNKKDRLQGIGLNFLISILQNGINIFIGLLMLLCFKEEFSFLEGISSLWFYLVLFICFLLAFWILNEKFSSSSFFKIQWLQKLGLDKYNLNTKISLVIASLLRYLCYLTQFVLLLIAFEVEWSWALWPAVSGVFLCQTLLPLPTLLAIVARAEYSVLFFTEVGISVEIAIASSLVLWVINLVIPSLVGMYIILKMDIFKQLKQS